jgi:hypothetical protein
MVKIIVSFVILLVQTAVGWFIPVLAAVVGFVLALVNIFKKPSPALVLSYAAVRDLRRRDPTGRPCSNPGSQGSLSWAVLREPS